MKETDWNLKDAMAVILNPTVDSRTWAEAVEWMMLYGPPGAREAIEMASISATCNCLPEIKPDGINREGELCYNIAGLARAMGMSEDEVGEKLNRLQAEKNRQFIFAKDETGSVH